MSPLMLGKTLSETFLYIATQFCFQNKLSPAFGKPHMAPKEARIFWFDTNGEKCCHPLQSSI